MEYAYANGMVALATENLQLLTPGAVCVGRALYDLSAKLVVDKNLFNQFEKEVRTWCISKNIGFDLKLLLPCNKFTPSYYARVFCTIDEANRSEDKVITWLVSRMLVTKYIMQNRWESFYQKESDKLHKLRDEYGSPNWIDAQVDLIRMQNKCVFERMKPDGFNVSAEIYAILEEHYHDCNNCDKPKRWADAGYDENKGVRIEKTGGRVLLTR